MRTQFLALCYPNGLPTNGVDAVEPGYSGLTLPTGCASMSRYTITSPGQRPGGDPQYTYLLYPTAVARNELVVWLAGHVGWSGYNIVDEGYTIPSLLAAGYHALVCDMPGFAYATNPVGSHIVKGGTWSYSAGTWSCTGGTLTEYPNISAHGYDFDSDGGPLAALQYFHHAYVSTTTAVASLNPGRTLLAGHSGGGAAACYLGAIDSRFTVNCINVPGAPYSQTHSLQSPVDYESYLLSAVYTKTPCAIDLWGVMRIAASWPGRTTDLVSSLNDEYWPPSDLTRWYEDAEAITDHTRRGGATFTHWLDPRTYPGHNMHTARINRMLGILGAS